jgi:hypothetical protein
MRKPIQAVEPGQIWIDNDKRQGGRRRLRVVSVEGRWANCLVITDIHGDPCSRKVSISVSRMRPTSTGYRLESTGEAGAL